MPKKLIEICAAILILLIILSGCNNFNREEVRKEHANSYPSFLAEKTNSILEQKTSFNLNDCIQIAMENNLSLKEAEIQEHLALLEKKVSFADFLPAVSLSYDKTWFDPQPQIKFGSNGLPMTDKDVREITWNIQLSIFNPATWFMYSMHTQGYEISKLVAEYTRQAIMLQIIVQYYQCLSLDKTLKAIEIQLDAAEVGRNELQALNEEGLVSNWQVEQANVLVLARQTEMDRANKSLKQAKSELLINMGLNPLDDINLEPQLMLEKSDSSLEDLITEALLNHPSMAISDREVAIEKEKIRAAVTAFLPNLTGFASRVDTSDSHQVFTNYWLGGLSAAITLFDGLANVNYYEAAKVLHQGSRIRREQATLTLMIQVIRAFDQLELAKAQVELVDQIERATKMRLVEMQEQYKQGLIQAGDMLSMTAEANQAEIQSIQARYQYQTCIAMLNNLIGQTQTEFKELANGAN